MFYSAIFWLILCTYVPGSGKELSIHFAGERLIYRMEYLALPAGEMSFHIPATEQVDANVYYHLFVRTKTNAYIKPLFDVNNSYESLFDTTSLLPWQLTKKIDQKNIKQQFTIYYDQEQHVASVADSGSWTIPDSCFSFLSMLYALRKQDFSKNKIMEFNIDSENLPVAGKATFAGEETIAVPAGKFPATKVILECRRLNTRYRPWRTDLLTNRMANPEAQTILWFSNDKRRLPLVIEFQQGRATVKLKLKKYQFADNQSGTK